MTTMNREEQKQVLIDTAKHIINRDNTSPYSENLRELARIALASLEAEPIGFRCRRNDNLGDWSYVYHREPDDFERKHLVIEGIYAAPPAQVVPEEKPMPNPLSMYAVDAVAAIAEVRGWSACRAAMLQGKSEQPQNAQQNIPENIPGGNSPVTPDGWISCSERMPDKLIPVMVMYEDGEMWSAMWNGNRWDDGTEYPDPHSVTHWREMPAAPQQEVK